MPRILIVEDHPINARLFVEFLRGENYEVEVALDAYIAENLLFVQSFDLILMDVALPGKSGLELTKEIRENDKLKHLPILCVSAYAMSGDADMGMEAGCTEYIVKPVQKRVLLEAAARLIRKEPDV